jgi:hypothetical protein
MGNEYVDWSEVIEALRRWAFAFAISPEELPQALARVLDYSLKAAFVLAVIMVVRRLPLIRETMREFNEGRGRIWDLRNTVSDLQRLAPEIKLMADRFELLKETVDTIREQNIQAQLQSTAERTDSGADGEIIEEGRERAAPEQGPLPPGQLGQVDVNWSKLQRFFLRNARRLQAKVEAISDGRTRAAYDRIGWRRPRRIARRLMENDLISGSAADASMKLIETFNKYKRRHVAVPDEVIGAMEVLDRQLERDIGPAPADEEPE